MGIKTPFISEIASDTYAINEFGLSAMYLVVGKEKALLIDTACGLTDLKSLVRSLTDLPVEVVLTHGHVDHVGGMGQFDEVWIHPADIEMAKSVTEEDLKDYADGLGEGGAYDVYDYSPAMVNTINHYPRFLPLADGQEFDLGGRKITAVFISGHTPGGVCFLDREKRIIFSGDCFNQNTLAVNCTVSHLLKELRKVKALEPEFDQNYNGHVGFGGMPSCLSQPKSVTDDLIHICDCILEGKDVYRDDVVMGKKAAVMEYGKVRLSYDREML